MVLASASPSGSKLLLQRRCKVTDLFFLLLSNISRVAAIICVWLREVGAHRIISRKAILKRNPYDPPSASEEVTWVPKKRSFGEFAIICLGLTCSGVSGLFSVLAAYAWCMHWWRLFTDSYMTNSFPWNAVAADLTWIAGYCIAGSILLMAFVYAFVKIFRCC